jgi:RNA polymerase sigma factor (TIGR02999 family)
MPVCVPQGEKISSERAMLYTQKPSLPLARRKHVGDITVLLKQWREGDRAAEQELFELVTPNLRKLAHHLMKGERQGHTLEATDLVNQIYLKLVSAKDRDWQDRAHFFALAARAMRRYLIDHARGRPAADLVAMEGMEEFIPADSVQIELALTVDKLLDELAESKPEWCQLVEVKFFLGLSDEQASEMLGIKLRTMQRMWRDARRWLFEHASEPANLEKTHAWKSTGR